MLNLNNACDSVNPGPGFAKEMRRLRALLLLLPLFCATAAQALEPGDKAPQFSAPALDGVGVVALSDYRGKIVYVDFWASWCPPCLVSFPLLDELRQQFSSAEFQILAVNVDREPERGRDFLERVSVGFPSASDPDGVLPQRFGLETMPSSYLIDQKGVIRHVQHGFRVGDELVLREAIRKLLGAGR